MIKKDFLKLHGSEEQKVTSNYATKSLATNYDIKDAFIEFIDNAYDAKYKGEKVVVAINIDNDKHIISFKDNGTGIKDASNLFTLGATNKETDRSKIGKYGVGVAGATATIATRCVLVPKEMVITFFESACDGKLIQNAIGTASDGETIIGKTVESKADENEHYTEIKFTNVILHQDMKEIEDAIKETFEIPMLDERLDVTINGRDLMKSLDPDPTFRSDCNRKKCKVGKFEVLIMSDEVGGESNSGDPKRAFSQSGLRIYDKSSGRLLAKNTDYWKWFSPKEAQQNICGLRCGIFIDSSLDSYKTFGIKPAKNGITYSKYYTKDDFKELAEELKNIYNEATDNKSKDDDEDVKIGKTEFKTTAKLANNALYAIVDGQNIILIKKKYKTKEIAELVNTIIHLQEKVSKKNS